MQNRCEEIKLRAEHFSTDYVLVVTVVVIRGGYTMEDPGQVATVSFPHTPSQVTTPTTGPAERAKSLRPTIAFPSPLV